jgi:hypothetical protein
MYLTYSGSHAGRSSVAESCLVQDETESLNDPTSTKW